MPECQNCSGFVTEQYVRVFSPPEEPSVRVCPNCEDKVRDGANVRQARSPRRNGNAARAGKVNTDDDDEDSSNPKSAPTDYSELANSDD